MPSFLGAFDFENVEAELGKATFDRREWTLLLGNNLRLLREAFNGTLDLLCGSLQVQIFRTCRGSHSSALTCMLQSLIPGIDLCPVRCVSRLNEADEVLDRDVSEVGVSVLHQ